MASGKKTNVSAVEDDDDLGEEPGEVVDSAPPMEVGEERPLNRNGLVKKLLKRGRGWETPELGDEATGTSLSFRILLCVIVGNARARERAGTGCRRCEQVR